MKNKYQPLNIFYICIIACSLAFFVSCSPAKNLVYFQNLQNDTEISNVVDKNFELKIRKNDLLSITIISPDPTSTPLFNGAPGVSSSSAESGRVSAGGSSGYLVDKDGNIVMYKLGNIHVEGLTRNELKNRLQTDLSPYLKDVVITVRFLSNKVTILGEVAKPQVLNILNEQITLLEAIAQSGDLTFTGRRDNILVIRETEAGKQFKRLNLSDNSIFTSPYYYLKPDDVVYVEPTESKIKSQNPQLISYVLSGVTILITIFSLLRR